MIALKEEKKMIIVLAIIRVVESLEKNVINVNKPTKRSMDYLSFCECGCEFA